MPHSRNMSLPSSRREPQGGADQGVCCPALNHSHVVATISACFAHAIVPSLQEKKSHQSMANIGVNTAASEVHEKECSNLI